MVTLLIEGVPSDLRSGIFEPFFSPKPAGVGTGRVLQNHDLFSPWTIGWFPCLLTARLLWTKPTL